MNFPDIHSTDILIEQGRQFHANRDLGDALQCYQRVLSEVPDNAEALHLSGLIAYEWEKYQEALVLFKKAIQLNPYNYQYYNDMGLVYEQTSLPENALKCFKQAMSIEKNDPAVCFNIANILFDQKKSEEAAEYYKKANFLLPQNVDILYNLASAYAAEGEIEEAVMCLRQAIAINPDFAEAAVNFGVIQQTCGDLDEAEKSYLQALTINPNLLEPSLNLASIYIIKEKPQAAMVLYKQLSAELQIAGCIDEACQVLHAALIEFPQETDFSYNLGTLYLSLGDYDQAENFLLKVIDSKSDHAMAYNNIGLVYKYKENFEESFKAFNAAIKHDPDLYTSHNNLGNLFSMNRQPYLAIDSYKKAIEMSGNYLPALSNLASELQHSGQLDEAAEIYFRLLDIDESNAQAQFNLGCIHLAKGDFKAGWPAYEWRTASFPGMLEYVADPRDNTISLPKPSSYMPFKLSGKSFLLLNDLDIGNELFFLRFLEKLKAQVADCYYLPSDKIKNLLIESSDVDLITDSKIIPEHIDYIMSITELPLVLGINSTDDIPVPVSLSVSKKEKPGIEVLYEKASNGKPVLGVTWQSDIEEINKPQMRVSPYLLGQSLSDWKGEFIVLQQDLSQEDLISFYRGAGRMPHDFSRLANNLNELLVVLDQLDEFVGVSCTSLYLRESLGKKSKVLIANPAEWRWMHTGDVSPWFPNSKIFRQDMNGDWQHGFNLLREELF